MLWIPKDGACRAGFDDAPELHHGDLVGDLVDDAEIMGDEHYRHVSAYLQIPDQLENLGLGRDVERGRWLVGDQDLWFKRKRHGDDDPLPLTAGQLKRIGERRAGRIGKADLCEKFSRPHFSFRPSKGSVGLEDFRNLVPDRHQRIERRHRFLKDHGDPASAQRSQFVFRQLQEILVFEENLAAGFKTLRQQTHHCVGRH